MHEDFLRRILYAYSQYGKARALFLIRDECEGFVDIRIFLQLLLLSGEYDSWIHESRST